ncbi:MAG: class I SAM-dependent methyltransferase [bacterium]|nr:class I SAM-dependent methyltransferase [bacterium]
MNQTQQDSITAAIQRRRKLMQEPYNTAFRLINGFVEQLPDLIIDIFGKTIVFHNYTTDEDTVDTIIPVIREQLPWLSTGIIKNRKHKEPTQQAGHLVFGETPDTQIEENGVKYALDLLMNQDASFYLDTRALRVWLKQNMKGKRVLNTFAYTGSLGVAAAAGKASEVIQLDLSKPFLSVAIQSALLNDNPCKDTKYHPADFWSRVNHYKSVGKHFDCVILDPPIFSKTPRGTIDTSKDYHKLINKVRPIIADGGTLITINNALFQSGKDHHDMLEELCKSGYLKIEKLISVPDDCIADPNGEHGLPADPAPYNNATKITILSVKKKDPTAAPLKAKPIWN